MDLKKKIGKLGAWAFLDGLSAGDVTKGNVLKLVEILT